MSGYTHLSRSTTMAARDKTSPFTRQSEERVRDEVFAEPTAPGEARPRDARELGTAAFERFAAVLRTAPVETTKTGVRDIRHVLFTADERPLWASTFESQWHRYICKPVAPSTIH
jgi:hypothetical protein